MSRFCQTAEAFTEGKHTFRFEIVSITGKGTLTVGAVADGFRGNVLGDSKDSWGLRTDGDARHHGEIIKKFNPFWDKCVVLVVLCFCIFKMLCGLSVIDRFLFEQMIWDSATRRVSFKVNDGSLEPTFSEVKVCERCDVADLMKCVALLGPHSACHVRFGRVRDSHFPAEGA